MTEAISNLVKNALDHTGKGGCISIEWRVSASILQITIKDNGSGIYPEELHHILKGFTGAVIPKIRRGTSFKMDFLI